MKNFTLFSLFFLSILFAEQTITVLASSDVHGHIFAWDYFSGKEKQHGLAQLARLVEMERETDPNLILLDNGDTIQGTALVDFFAKRGSGKHPMAIAMNAMQYDGMVIGNHEFNYGQDVLQKFRDDANFPVAAANILRDGKAIGADYFIFNRKGLRIAVIPLCTPMVPNWEKPSHIVGLSFEDPIQTLERILPKLRAENPNAILVSAHAGIGRQATKNNDKTSFKNDISSWPAGLDSSQVFENFVHRMLVAYPDIDAVISGHAHRVIPKVHFGRTVITAPGKFGQFLSKLVLNFDKNTKLETIDSELIDAQSIPIQNGFDISLQKQHDETLAMISAPIVRVTKDFPKGASLRNQDNALADFINHVQAQFAAESGFPVEASLSAIFNNSVEIPKGDVSLADIYKLYQYENTLVVLELSVAELKDILEKNAEYWQKSDGHFPSPDSSIPGYNWDMFSGFEYALDLTKEPGQRLKYFRRNGREMKNDEILRIAVNNYRAAGGGGFPHYANAKRLWESDRSIRDEIVKFLESLEELSPESYFEKNWELIY